MDPAITGIVITAIVCATFVACMWMVGQVERQKRAAPSAQADELQARIASLESTVGEMRELLYDTILQQDETAPARLGTAGEQVTLDAG